MARRGGGRRSYGSGGGGGGNGLGLLSLFNFHSVVGCSADDDSLYCSLMKLVNAVGGVLFLMLVLYVAYSFLMKKPMMGGSRHRRCY
tara:strand:+ start:3691 stop:3951 length:261 start_codon:yes stop_codon:yes gene_type:complete